MGSDAEVEHILEIDWSEFDGNGSYQPDYDFYGNETNRTLVVHQLGYSTLHIIISSIILTFMMIVVVIGNMLVIIAIATEKSLKNLQNWFIASLAVADFFVGLLIMPFSLANELMGYWIFGTVWCSIHSAMDVLLCTSSIMNICLISLDRYWSITQAVDYLKKRTPARAAVMIGMVWVLSALISIPPLLGWRAPDAQDEVVPKCELSREIGYVLYSALGSFYIPSCIMVFVYIRIYFAARARARRAVRKPPKPSKPPPSAIEIEESKSKAAAAKAPPPKPKVPLSAPAHLTTSPVELNECGKPPSSPVTPEGRCVKQVGFQDPLVMTSEVLVKPEITVEGCSPEDSDKQQSNNKTRKGNNKDKTRDNMTVTNTSPAESGVVPAAAEISSEANKALQSQPGQSSSSNNNNNSECTGESVSRAENSAKTVAAVPSCGEEKSDEGDSSSKRDECSKSGNGKDVGGNGESSCGQTTTESPCGQTTTESPIQTAEEQEKEKKTNQEGGEAENKCENVLQNDGVADEAEAAADVDESGSQPLVPTIQLRDVGGVEDPLARVAHHSALAVSELENKISELQSNGSRGEETSTSRSSKRSKRPKLHFLRVETPTIWRTSSSLSLNGDVHILGTLSRSCSRLQLDTDPVSDVEPSSSDSGAISRCAVVKPLKLRLCQPFFGKKASSASGKARRDVLDMGKLPSPKEVRDPEREKRRIARKKEKRATLILGLIMGSFILCWLPFFFLYILEPLCPSCEVAPWGFAIAFWLGYMNSALNPVIYTIFNKDFRRAFRRILFK